MDLRVIGWEGLDWIHLAENRDQWKTLMKMEIKVWVPKRWGIF
jgi:hypothetical protein